MILIYNRHIRHAAADSGFSRPAIQVTGEETTGRMAGAGFGRIYDTK